MTPPTARRHIPTRPDDPSARLALRQDFDRHPDEASGRSGTTGAGARGKRRADAEESIERIVRAAVARLAAQPDASMAQIASDAGVGRVTLYAHFSSREAVLDAALRRAIAEGDEVLDTLDLSDPVAGLRSLVESGWSLTARASALLEAASGVLSADQIRDLHARPERRVIDLIERGQSVGVFRADMSSEWLASVMHHLMKGAAADVSAGRIDRDAVGSLLSKTVLAAYAPRRQ